MGTSWPPALKLGYMYSWPQVYLHNTPREARSMYCDGNANTSTAICTLQTAAMHGELVSIWEGAVGVRAECGALLCRL